MSNITDIGYIEDISTDISDIFIPAKTSGNWKTEVNVVRKLVTNLWLKREMRSIACKGLRFGWITTLRWEIQRFQAKFSANNFCQTGKEKSCGLIT